MGTGLRLRSKLAFWYHAHVLLSRALAAAGIAGIIGVWYRHTHMVEKTHMREWHGTFKPSFLVHLLIRGYFKIAIFLAQKWHKIQDMVSHAMHNKQHSIEARALRSFFNLGAGLETFDLKSFRTPFSALINEIPDTVLTEHVVFDKNENFDAFWISLSTHTQWRHPNLALPHLSVVNPSAPSEPAESAEFAVMWIHGGGFVSGDVAGFKAACYKLSELLGGAPVLFPQYRMAPEHSLRDSVNDCIVSYEYITSHFKRVAIVADSAGGCLALHLMQQISLILEHRNSKLHTPLHSTIPSPSRESLETSSDGETSPTRRISKALNLVTSWSDPESVREPCCAALLSPVTDLTAETMVNVEHVGVMFNQTALKTVYDKAVGDDCPLTLSPLHAPKEAWSNVPSLMIAAADDEILYEDSRQLAEIARLHNIDVVEHFKSGVFHTWPVFWQHLPEGERSMQAIATYVQERCQSLPV